MEMHLLISDVRVRYWTTIAVRLAVGAAGMAFVACGIASLVFDAPAMKAADPYVVIVGGTMLAVAAAIVTMHRTSVYSMLVGKLRREVDVLETATDRARDDMRRGDVAIA